MKRVIISLLFLLSITVLFFPSCDYTKLSNKNEKKADIKQDSTMLDVAVEDSEDDGIGDEENWSDEEYYNDDDYRDPETKKLDGLYTDLLPGKWIGDVLNDSGSEFDQGVKTSHKERMTQTSVFNPDFTYNQRIYTRMDFEQEMEYTTQLNGFGSRQKIKYGITVEIIGESSGNWYVDNLCLIQNTQSWKITPKYHKHHGESRSDYRDLENELINAIAPEVRGAMDAMKENYSSTTSQQIAKLESNKLVILANNGESYSLRKQQ